ncbi:methyltransferase, FxLD system [Actinacidiphila sp. bgisy145]|uniref:methyltransferase, FxLD system n=1 Tax=Actinacidiphila sp. bgisy145 TaxID=3413792 RepID=UPI003EBBE8C9
MGPTMYELDGGSRWRQVNLRCRDWEAAEHMAVTHLGPFLTDAETTGTVSGWWLVRKAETWRLRFLPRGEDDQAAAAFLDHLTTTLIGRAAIQRAHQAVYEPETYRFGGPEAMAIAHRLFHADSRQILQYLARVGTGDDHRRELAVRLGTRMMTAAGQDFYEQGDIWAQVAEHRTDAGAPQPGAPTLTAVQFLVTAASDSPGSPLTLAPDWPTAFEDAGRALTCLAQQGALTRGLRAILTDHLLFAFNRLGIPAQHQYLLATAASRVIFHRQPAADDTPYGSRNDHAQPLTVKTVTTDMTDQTTTEPQRLREALVAFIDRLGTFRTPEVKAAFRSVPRHLFLPGVDLATAYARKAVVTKRAADGTAVSSASGPNIVATMLEQLQAAPGHRVLEIGAATGINAALLTELVGPTGHVTTIELDDDLAESARTNLAAAGYGQVEVICGDGALGHPAGAPYDRIEVTAGAWDISAAWWQQLALGGRIVVPLRLHGSGLTRSLAFDRTDEHRMRSTNASVCGFVPMRGASEMGERHVRLADDVILKLDADDLPDEPALAQALTHPAHQHWTGIHVRHDEPAAHLDLWLATTDSDLSFGRLSIGPAAHVLGLATPAIRWAGATLYDGATISYLTTRPVDDDTDELGLITHGPDSNKLNSQVLDLLSRWNDERPAQPVITAYPAATPDGQLAPGAHVTRPDTRLTISW